MKGMLTCKEASLLASKSLDARLSWREGLGLRLHLMACDICRRYLRELRFLRSALARTRTGDDAPVIVPSAPRLSTDARSRIEKVLSEDDT